MYGKNRITGFGIVYWGSGNIDSIPEFENNFHLSTISPCVDAGNPLPIYNDFDGTRNDMGAYGGPDGNW